MSTTMQELTTRRNANLAKARTIMDQAKSRNLTSSEEAEADTLVKAVRADNDAIKDRKDAKATSDQIASWLSSDRDLEDDGGGPGQGKGRRTFERVGKAFAESAVQGFKAAGPGFKAAQVSTMGNFIGGTPYVPGTHEEVIGPDPRLGILGLVSVEQHLGEGNGFAYVQASEDNTSNAKVVPDRGLKPQSKKAFRELHDVVKVLAHRSEPMPNRFLTDHVGFRDYLSSTMTRDLLELLNAEILTGDGEEDHLKGILNTAGVQQQAWATNLPTTLRKARSKLQVRNEQPTAFLMSIEDAEAVDLATDDNGTYQSLDPLLGGLPIVPTAALSPGQAIVGDFRLVKLYQKGGIELRASDASPFDTGEVDADDKPIYDGTLFMRNMFELLAEMRAGGTAITRPSGLVVVDTTA